MNPLDFKAEKLEDLEPWQIEVLTLHVLAIELTAKIALHTFIFERFLSKSLNGQELEQVYKNDLDAAKQRALAQLADTYPNRASMVSALLSMKK